MEEILNDEKKSIFNFCSKINLDEKINIHFNLNNLNLIDIFNHYKKNEFIKNNKLRIIYNYLNNQQYIIQINELDNICSYINFFKRNQNHIIFNSLSKSNDKKLHFYKINENENNLVLSHYNLKLSSNMINKLNSEETSKIKNLKFNDKFEIDFEFVNNLTITLQSNKILDLALILSSSKKSNNISHIHTQKNNYSLDIELKLKKKLANQSDINILYKNIADILKLINRSHLLVSANYKDEILLKYSKLLFNNAFYQHIYLSRKSVSLDKNDCITYLPNNYAVTDKADGERQLLFISGNNVLLISSDLSVKHTGIILKSNKFNNTLIDGELIINKDFQLYMAFDIIFKNGTDLRIKNLIERVEDLHSILKDCFSIKIPDTKNMKTNDLTTICNKEIDSYINNFENKYINNKFHIYYKYYAYAKGLQDNEIFIYSDLIWNKYNQSHNNIPYKLDGLIYTPINSDYISNSMKSDLKEFKLKPIEHLTIDFYIKFERNSKTGEFIILYDNTKSKSEYCKCYLYINDTSNKSKHVPILFREKYQEHYTYIQIKDNIVLSSKNEILEDNIVVEFSYNSSNDKYFRWIPNRIRYDKTDIIEKYSKNYGNNELTASYNWNIITNPITFEDIKLLANNYKDYKKKIISTINNNIKFYDFKTGYVLPMRAFHNWLKHTLIFNYCRNLSNSKNSKGKNVLDIGIGKGGDLYKLYSAGINKVVGIDIDNNSFNIPNGTIDKFKNLPEIYKKNINILPKNLINNSINGIFIKANAAFDFSVEKQLSIYPDLSQSNINFIKKHIMHNKFDIINCQFAVHYMFEKRDYVLNFFNNINKLLTSNGYLLLTCFDGDLLMKTLKKNNGVFEIFQITKDKNIIFNITNLYKNDEELENQEFGLPINVINKLYSSIGKIEYIVKKDVLIKYADEIGNLELVETDLFYNFYELNRNLINNIYYNNLFNENYNKSINNVYDFYNFKTSLDNYSLDFSKLNRYYVFRKK